MPYIDKKLLKAAKDGKNICPDEGEPVVAIYKGYKIEEDEKFGGFAYRFLFSLADGSLRDLKTKSKKVLSRFAYISPGSKIEITRFGEGKEKSFEIKVLREATQPAQSAQEPEEPAQEEQELDGDDPVEVNF